MNIIKTTYGSNDSNIKKYRPYIEIDNNIVVDYFWWDCMESMQCKYLKNKFEIIIDDKFNRKHNGTETTLTEKFYEAYNSTFDITKPINNDMVVKQLTDYQKKTLIEYSNSYQLTNKRVSLDYESEDLLNSIIKDTPLYNNKHWFVRLGCSTHKHDHEIFPIYNHFTLLKTLTCSRIYYNEYNKKNPVYIVFKPWRDINKRNEFRAFFVNNKLIAMTQQYWYDIYNYTDSELDIISNLYIKPSLFKSCCVDLYIDFDTKKWDIIEYNPMYCSGAGLCPDYYELLYGSNESNLYVRI
jgi:hypothetical protein